MASEKPGGANRRGHQAPEEILGVQAFEDIGIIQDQTHDRFTSFHIFSTFNWVVIDWHMVDTCKGK